jgi:hypothetical protein
MEQVAGCQDFTLRERPVREWFDESGASGDNRRVVFNLKWACGAAGSALPWHGRGHRFDPDQVHQ